MPSPTDRNLTPQPTKTAKPTRHITQLDQVTQLDAARDADPDFRADCLRELKIIKKAWPDLHYSTAKGALILSPSPPLIAPSQLRRAEAEITDV